MSNAKLPTSLRAYAEQRAAEAKTDAGVQPLGRPRVFAASPLDILVFPERNIRPISRDTIEEYKLAFERGDVFPAIDVTVEQGRIVLEHGYHRTLAAQELVREKPDMAHLQLELREFKGNASDRIVMMLNAQNALPVDPVSRAEAYRTLVNQGMPVAKVAERVGRTPEHVSQQLILVEADELVKQAIRTEKVSATAVIELIREEKQGGMRHGEVVAAMLSNAEAAGKPKATLKHRAQPSSTQKLSIKTVRSSLKSLGEITGSLRQALSSCCVDDGQPVDDQEALVALSLPANKVAELLALLEMQAAPEQQAQDADSK
ncbi:hypothetical protein [Stutzerimonas stutzeri]|uniref:hypothetical protein n=1 Tax=Stutzerimonas stutzeri TaxID=316 RepID=UPI0015E373C0|nr:hypothetical protein [Stutzerimonas stutzeri]MBA1280272.1 hypothetical protein [Stutzerimonas stutzeri]